MSIPKPNVREYVAFTGAAGTNDNDVIYTSEDISLYTTHMIQSTGSGIIDVDVSLDHGSTWTLAVAGRNIATTGVFTQVSEAATTLSLGIKGRYTKMRVNQKGATAANASGHHAIT